MPLIEWGYINLIVTLLVASLLSIALIILPVWFLHRRRLISSDKIKGVKVVCYFFTIGLAYLFIEIAFIQKFTQLLHHPIYSIAVTLTAFLAPGITNAQNGLMRFPDIHDDLIVFVHGKTVAVFYRRTDHYHCSNWYLRAVSNLFTIIGNSFHIPDRSACWIQGIINEPAYCATRHFNGHAVSHSAD